MSGELESDAVVERPVMFLGKPALVTVIVVSYNSGPLLIECVQRVLESSIPVEVIVSDNCSIDSSVECLKDMAASDSRLRLMLNRRNLGFACGNNIALPFASGQHVLFLNPDCIVEKDTLERMVSVLDTRPDAGMAGCRIMSPDGVEDGNGRRQIPTPASLLRGLLGIGVGGTGVLAAGRTSVEAISGAFMLVRRTDLDLIGSFDEQYFMHWEDLDLCLRFRLAGRAILFVPDVEVVHYKGRSSASAPLRVEWHKHHGLIRFFRKFYFPSLPLVAFAPVAIAVVTRFLAQVATSRFRQKRGAESPIARQSAVGTGEVWVFGATSLIGIYLLPRLLAAGYRVRAFGRSSAVLDGSLDSPLLRWERFDLTDPSSLPASGCPEILIHLAPIHLLPPMLDLLAARDLRKVIAFSSTSASTKLDSIDEGERALANRLASAEQRVREICSRTGIHWAVIRPTMIYSLGHDRNITRLARLINGLSFFPIPGTGKGLRQPVHADDLAKACVLLLDTHGAWNRSYELSGGEVLSYRAMVERIFASLGKTPRIVCIPERLWRVGLAMMRLVPGFRDLNSAMIRRIDADLCFSHDEAKRAFGYCPRGFLDG